MKKVINKILKGTATFSVASAIAVASVMPVQAAVPVQASFVAQLIINGDCVINSAGNLDFGSSGVLSAAIDGTAVLSIQCTNTLAYDIGLDAGTGGGTTATRKMKSAAGPTVDYNMYTDAGHTVNWGNTLAADTKSDTGSGAAQLHTIYGQVPIQTTPAAGTYTDTVTVTVTF